jgi:large subunit ribosomal protein L15
MKLHDLRPAPGSRTPRIRVGRGIAAGGGKTAGRGTKGQKARAGGSIPPWFEGGQTPLHQRIPKLRGFRNPFKVEYEIVNLGRIAALVELGALEPGEPAEATKPGADKPKAGKTSSAAPITVNQEILRAVGLVRTLDKPMKVLGQGEIDRPLFVVADAFSTSAVTKIEAAGGSVQVLQIPTRRQPALGVELPAEGEPRAEGSADGASDGSTEGPVQTREARSGATAVETAPAGATAVETAPAETATTRPPKATRPAAAAAAAEPAAPAEPAPIAESAAPAEGAASAKPARGSGRTTAGGATSARAKAKDEAPAKQAKPARPARTRAGAAAAVTMDAESDAPAAEDSPETPAGTDA